MLPDISAPMSPGRIVPVQNEQLIDNGRFEKLKKSLTVGNAPIKAKEDILTMNLNNPRTVRN